MKVGTKTKPSFTKSDMKMMEGAYLAWTEPGINPEYHERMKTKVRAFMPVLAHHLDAMERVKKEGRK